MPTPKKHKFNIFDVLGKINKKNTKFFRAMPQEEQKAIAPVVLMRWMSGTTDARQIFFLNEAVNPYVFPLAKHPELLIDLMTICAPGQFKKYKWHKSLNKRSSSTPTAVSVIRNYFEYSQREAQDSLPLLSNDDILDYAEQLGYQKDEITKLKKELKSRG